MAARHFAFALIFVPLITLSAQPDRIAGPIDNDRTVILKGHLNSNAQMANDRGALDPWTPIRGLRLVLQPSGRQAAQLEQFLEEQRDPSSVNYRHWLTPEEYGERFGLSENDLGRLTSWLQSHGFTVDRVARARNWITFSGTAEQVGRAFRTELRRYDASNDNNDNDAEPHFAPATEPSIPAALAGIVSTVRGLDDFRPKAPVHKELRPEFNGSSGAHYLAPDDLATIYDIAALYQAGFNGTGQKLVIAGQTDLKVSDINAFRAQFNLPANPPQTVLFGADPGVHTGDAVEADLDVEWAGAVARNAAIIYVYSTNVFESVQYAIDEDLAPIISLSYGGCESGAPASYRTMAQQANALGITWMSASGDSAAAGCDPQGEKSATQGPGVTFPADIPEVTAVGGAEFNEGSGTFWNSQEGANGGSAISYIPEKAWNDTSLGYGIEGSGGGASTLFSKPWWQAGPGVPNDQARDVPDVSLTASADHDGYIICSNSQVNGNAATCTSLIVVGGTSASTPSFAGMVALINHYVVAKGIQSKAGLGNINPTLYSLAQSSTGAFHDITSGDNIVPCTTGTPGCVSGSFGYKAGPGYDLATGLGSVDAYKLVTNWATLPPSVGTTTTLSANPANIAQNTTLQLTATVKAVSGSNPPSGSVTFSDAGGSLGSATVVASAGTAGTGTAVLTVNGSALKAGANTITGSYAAASNFANSTGSTTVTVTAAAPIGTTTTVTANPATIASTATTQLTATVKAASGAAAPSGSVKFALGNTALGTATLTASGTSATAVLMVNGSSLAAGSNTISASYVAATSGPGNFSSSTGSVTVTVTVATTTTVAANPTNIASSGTTQLTATVRAATSNVSTSNASTSNAAPAGSVAFSVGNTALGSASLSNGTASLTIKGSSLSPGSNTITVNYTAAGNYSSSSGSVSVTVTVPATPTTTTLTANPTTIASTATTLLTATVKAATGTTTPTGSLTFGLGNTSLGSVSLSNGTASLTVKGSSLSPGSNTITVNYTAAGNYTSSSGSVSVTVTVPATPTTTTLTANPTTIASTATTLLTATVKAATGTTTPTGSLTFGLGNTSLGSVSLSNGTASLTVKGSSLSPGSNTITVNYTAAGNYTSSSGSVSVTVTVPATPTTTTLTANPTTIASTATTLLTATVKAATGTTTPTGSLTFGLGNTTLGSVSLSNGTASLTVKASSLSIGGNTITATYSGNLANSTGSATVTVTSPPVTTTTTVTANPTGISATGTTQLTATVKPASGSVSPTGSVVFTVGNTSLGSALLTGSGATATATLTIKGSSLALGSNPITAAWSGTGSFAGSSSSVTVTVTSPATSKVLVTVTPEPPSTQVKGWLVEVQLQEQACVATTITSFTINGTDFSSLIASAFGSSQLAAHGTLQSNLAIQWSPLPANLVFGFSGVDAGGSKWSQTVSSATTK